MVFQSPLTYGTIRSSPQAKKDIKQLRLDLSGRGYSSNLNIDYTDELFANQVIELMNELKIEKGYFLGIIKRRKSNFKNCLLKT
jgi:hypothetical protein